MFFIEDRNQTKYMIKYICVGDRHRIVASDLIRIWLEEMSSEDIVNRCKELNPNIEAPSEKLLARVINLIGSLTSDVGTDIVSSEEKLCLSLETRVSRFLFRFKFELSLSDPAVFAEEVTCPLILMVKELQARVMHLCELLKRKDVEIQQYKLEGAQISRRSVETEPFKKEDFQNQYLTKDNENVQRSPTDMITADVFELWKSLALSHTSKSYDTNLQIKKEMDFKIKEEPMSSDDSESRESDYVPMAATVEPKTEPGTKPERDTILNNSHDADRRKKVVRKKLRL